MQKENFCEDINRKMIAIIKPALCQSVLNMMVPLYYSVLHQKINAYCPPFEQSFWATHYFCCKPKVKNELLLKSAPACGMCVTLVERVILAKSVSLLQSFSLKLKRKTS